MFLASYIILKRSNIVRGRSRVTARRRPRPNRSRVSPASPASPALPDVFSITGLCSSFNKVSMMEVGVKVD